MQKSYCLRWGRRKLAEQDHQYLHTNYIEAGQNLLFGYQSIHHQRSLSQSADFSYQGERKVDNKASPRKFS